MMGDSWTVIAECTLPDCLEVADEDREEQEERNAALIVAAVNALPGLLDRVERAERERDDLDATLATRDAEHAAALRALSDARVVVDASMTFSDGVDPWCKRCGTDWADAEHPKRCIVGRFVAVLGTTAEVSRG